MSTEDGESDTIKKREDAYIKRHRILYVIYLEQKRELMFNGICLLETRMVSHLDRSKQSTWKITDVDKWLSPLAV